MPLGTWHDQRDALPTRFDKARLEAARRLEPKAVSVKLPAATIKTPDDLDLWLDAIRDKILERLKEGPVNHQLNVGRAFLPVANNSRLGIPARQYQ